MNDGKEAKRGNINIRVGSIVTSKDIETEDKNNESRIGRIRKEVVVYVNDMGGENKFQV